MNWLTDFDIMLHVQSELVSLWFWLLKSSKDKKVCVPQHVLLDLCVVCVFCYFSIDGYERYLQVEVYVRLIFIFCVVK